MNAWLDHVERWRDCQLCPLACQRANICLARGTVPCDVLFVGEAPGISEDVSGLPFTGPAGDLLDRIIERCIPSTPAPGALALPPTYALTNLVACFPREAKTRGDNEPERAEILECRPRLVDFVNIAQPQLIVRVGKLAGIYLGFDLSVPIIDIDHPAHILRMPLAQRQMAVQRNIVHLRNSVEDVVRSEGEREPWKPWGTKHASIEKHAGESYRNHLRDIYRDAGDDPRIPF